MKKLQSIFMAVVILLSVVGVANAHWNLGDGHKMHFPQLPDPNGWDVYATSSDVNLPVVVADDWRCSETG